MSWHEPFCSLYVLASLRRIRPRFSALRAVACNSHERAALALASLLGVGDAETYRHRAVCGLGRGVWARIHLYSWPCGVVRFKSELLGVPAL